MLNTQQAAFLGIVGLALSMASLGQGSDSSASSSLNSKNGRSVTIVFHDGHRQSYPLADVSRIEFKDPAEIFFRDGHHTTLPLNETARIEFTSSLEGGLPLGRNHFVGKWKVGEGNGSHFFITLKSDGKASKSIGARHGTWTVVDGEARIAWDDNWHDVIRRVGTRHEKVAYEPGKTFADEPSNVADAARVEAEPI
jgi:hypothetical protein